MKAIKDGKLSDAGGKFILVLDGCAIDRLSLISH
jgi:hypothetical protein